MDLHEDAGQNIVTATFEFPGVKKEDVQLEFHNGRLTVSAENKISEEHNENGYAVRERRYGKWSRTLQLPTGTRVSRDLFEECEQNVLTMAVGRGHQGLDARRHPHCNIPEDVPRGGAEEDYRQLNGGRSRLSSMDLHRICTVA